MMRVAFYAALFAISCTTSLYADGPWATQAECETAVSSSCCQFEEQSCLWQACSVGGTTCAPTPTPTPICGGDPCATYNALSYGVGAVWYIAGFMTVAYLMSWIKP